MFVKKIHLLKNLFHKILYDESGPAKKSGPFFMPPNNKGIKNFVQA